MQAGLLDFIFENLEVEILNRKEVHDHLNYLNEIITTGMSAPDQVKYLALKVKLNNRLIHLDRLSCYRACRGGSCRIPTSKLPDQISR
jgi:hypothetical protein